MQPRSGIRVETYIPLVRRAGEQPALEAWTWWHFEAARLSGSLPDSQGPWMIRTEWHLWVRWIVMDEEQFVILIDFLEKTRREFALEALHFDYQPVTFGLIE
jgi:hypothetical protein